MNKKRLLYIFVVSLIAFVIWIIGEFIIARFIPDATMAISRGWVVIVFSAACAWSLIRFHREDKKAKEEEENENYKSIY
ncbi:MAG: hypothetical protein IJC75_02085 [Oscillospiraceae bacterium]|nr:hypothetical protein [Ruminococcus sp.]MBQ4345905.1 hypothetical protein [Oscillospiraceae bacterium]